MVLSGKKNQKNVRDKFFTLYSLKRDELILTISVRNQELIGRLKTNLYDFVGGHIYYNDKVIKVRYDLIDNLKGGELKENQLFDYYHNIIKL